MKVGIATCLLLAIVLCVGFIALSPGSGPTYQGRTARRWIQIYFSGYSGRSPEPTREEMDEAKRAIRAMGTNVLPYAVRLVSRDYPKFLRSFYDNADRAGYTILDILGTNARPAAPALIKLTRDPESRIRSAALNMLHKLELDEQTMLPVMLAMSRDPVPWLREVSIQKFLTWYPEQAEAHGFTWEALDAATRRRARSEAALARAQQQPRREDRSPPTRKQPAEFNVPAGYQEKIVRLLAEEASAVARELGLPEKLPITEADVAGAYVPPPALAERIGSIGTISTTNYNYYMSVRYKFSFLDRVDLQAEYERLRREYRWPMSKVDTNAAHQFATQLLARVSMDVQALERDCLVTVHPTIPEGARGEWFVPVYWVYWVRRGEDRPVASVQFAEPTGAVLQLRVARPEYILRRPIQPPSSDVPSGGAPR